MKSLGLILFQPLFLLCFCFKNLDLSTIPLTHVDFSLIALFVIITFIEPILFECFYSLNNKFACFIMMAIFFLTTYFKTFNFIE